MQVRDRYVYPAVFDYTKEGPDDADGITVTFPDLPGCITEGINELEALDMAREALALTLSTMEDDGEHIPNPTPVLDIPLAANQTVVVVDVWMPPHRAAIHEQIVRKTVTLPNWLNSLAENAGVNFSQVLQHALKDVLGIRENGPAFVKHRTSDVTVRSSGSTDSRWTVRRRRTT